MVAIASPFVILIAAYNIWVPQRNIALSEAMVTEACSDALQTLNERSYEFSNPDIINASSASNLAAARHILTDETENIRCEVEYGTTREFFVTRLVTDGADVTRELRLKEQN